MQRVIKVGTISWIEGMPSPVWTSGQAAVLGLGRLSPPESCLHARASAGRGHPV